MGCRLFGFLAVLAPSWTHVSLTFETFWFDVGNVLGSMLEVSGDHLGPVHFSIWILSYALFVSVPLVGGGLVGLREAPTIQLQ